jgi:hypothetical protein
MKRLFSIGVIAMSLWACNGAGDRTHDMPTVTDSNAAQSSSSGANNKRNGDTTPTTNDNIYNTDSSRKTNGLDSSVKHLQSQQTKSNEKHTNH